MTTLGKWVNLWVKLIGGGGATAACIPNKYIYESQQATYAKWSRRVWVHNPDTASYIGITSDIVSCGNAIIIQ